MRELRWDYPDTTDDTESKSGEMRWSEAKVGTRGAIGCGKVPVGRQGEGTQGRGDRRAPRCPGGASV